MRICANQKVPPNFAGIGAIRVQHPCSSVVSIESFRLRYEILRATKADSCVSPQADRRNISPFELQ
jgi:hypothetical protein